VNTHNSNTFNSAIAYSDEHFSDFMKWLFNKCIFLIWQVESLPCKDLMYLECMPTHKCLSFWKPLLVSSATTEYGPRQVLRSFVNALGFLPHNKKERTLASDDSDRSRTHTRAHSHTHTHVHTHTRALTHTHQVTNIFFHAHKYKHLYIQKRAHTHARSLLHTHWHHDTYTHAHTVSAY